MKKFLKKTSLFLLPIFMAFIFTECFYSTKKGDLLRIGYLADIYNYDSELVFKNEFVRKIFYSEISELDLSREQNFKILVIGDSFSEFGLRGYNNYLAETNNNSLLNFNSFLCKNPLQALYSIINGGVLDKIKVEYIVLQSVERAIVERASIDTTMLISIDSLKNKFVKYKIDKKLNDEKKSEVDRLFSNRLLKFTFFNIKYLFSDNAFNSATYAVNSTDKLFSANTNKLLFLENDIKALENNSNFKKVEKLNNELNELSKKLSEKGIKLIVLPCPDKYDLYYEYIVNKQNYPKPLFFEHLYKMPKNYLFIDAKSILKNAVKHQKDIYKFDDSHWSPISSKLVANEINRIIKNRK